MTQFPRAAAKKFAGLVLGKKTLSEVVATIRSEADKHQQVKNGWRDNLNKLADGLESGAPGFKIFMKGKR